MFFRRALSSSAVRRSDLVQQAFLNKVKEYGKVGSDLSNSDPTVKKALMEELNRVSQKYNLTSPEAVSKIPTQFEAAKVESAVAAAFEGESISKMLEGVKAEEKTFLAAQAARRSEEARKAAALNAKA